MLTPYGAGIKLPRYFADELVG